MPIKVLIVDDSILVQKLLKDIINSEEDMEVMAVASDPYIAREIISKEKPDIITLDIDMPKMNGLTFLKSLKKHYPIPTLIISTLTRKDSDMEIRALELGAYDVVEKPSMFTKDSFYKSKQEIIEKIRASIYIDKLREFNFSDECINYSKNSILSKNIKSEKIVVIGASTGGPEAVYKVIKNLPENYYSVIVVMHMPERFTNSYAARLNNACKMNVKEAEDGDCLIRGRILIAPGNHNLYVKKCEEKDKYFVIIKKDEPYKHYRPSINLTLFSLAKASGKNVIAVILTGMGDDGAEGMDILKKKGAYTIAQNEESSVVYGMPKAAISKKCVDKILDLDEIAIELESLLKI